MRNRTSPPLKLVLFPAVRREPSSGAHGFSEEGRDVVLEADARAVVLAVAIARAIADGAALRRQIVVLAIGARLLAFGVAFARLLVAVAVVLAIIAVAMTRLLVALGAIVALRAVVARLPLLARPVLARTIFARTVVAAMALLATVTAGPILAARTFTVVARFRGDGRRLIA